VVYVYDLFATGTPAPIATLNNPAPSTNDTFGQGLAASGDRVVIGAPGEEAKQAYVFDLSATGTPTPVAILDSPSLAGSFGRAVGLSGGLAVVGQPLIGGFAYVYDLAGGASPPVAATLVNPVPGPTGEFFGTAVAISGQRTVVGSRNPAPGTEFPEIGQAFVFGDPPLPPPVNTAPTITDVANQSSTGAAVGPVGFTIGDAETAVGNLTVTSASTNPTWTGAGPIGP
jgi:hypothetical protein